MSSYVRILTKEKRPKLQSFRDDIKARNDADNFRPNGTQIYIGRQGSGKTISAVKHMLDLKERYPKACLVTNLKIENLIPITFVDLDDLKQKMSKGINCKTHYILFSEIDQLAIVLTNVNNGKKGVLYLIDEIHTYFNSLESKNIPPYIFTEISQQRKQRKCIVGTSQLFTRLAKPFREQTDTMIKCFTIAGFITFQIAFDGASITQDYDGTLRGKKIRIGWFFQTPKLRAVYDTYQKVVSGATQFEEFSNFDQNQTTKKSRKK